MKPSVLFSVAEAIREYLMDMKDRHLAERELKEVRAGRSETITLAEAMKRYGVED